MAGGSTNLDMVITDADVQMLLTLSDKEVWYLLTGVSSWKPDVGKAVMDRRMKVIQIPIRTTEGRKEVSITVNAVLTNLFRGFFNDLYTYCPDFYIYNNEVSGYNYRNIKGSGNRSAHAYGAAVDINYTFNPEGTKVESTCPNPKYSKYYIYDSKDNPVLQVAKKYSLAWGGRFKSNPDGMHFSFTGDLSRENIKKFYSTW